MATAMAGTDPHEVLAPLFGGKPVDIKTSWGAPGNPTSTATQDPLAQQLFASFGMPSEPCVTGISLLGRLLTIGTAKTMSRVDLVHIFSDIVNEKLKPVIDSIDTFFKSVLRSNVRFESTRYRLGAQVDALTAQMLSECQAVQVPSPPLCNLDSVVESVPKVHERMKGALYAAADAVAESVRAAVRRFEELEQVGRVQFQALDGEQPGARLYYYRWIAKENLLATRRQGEIVRTGRNERTISRTMERDIRRSLIEELHIHHLLGVERHAIHDVKPACLPPEAAELVSNIPAWLRPQVELVTGQEMWRKVLSREHWGETKTEKLVVEETQRFHSDPAVVLIDKDGAHGTVLTGWSADEEYVGWLAQIERWLASMLGTKR